MYRYVYVFAWDNTIVVRVFCAIFRFPIEDFGNTTHMRSRAIGLYYQMPESDVRYACGVRFEICTEHCPEQIIFKLHIHGQ